MRNLLEILTCLWRYRELSNNYLLFGIRRKNKKYELLIFLIGNGIRKPPIDAYIKCME